MRTRDRKGIGAFDVLVVLAVLAVLAAVLLPAMYHTRGAGDRYRRSDCKNKLKHIGFAILSYEDTHKTLPPGWIAVRGPYSGENEQSAYGWGTYILPFLDNAPLYKKIHWQDADPTFAMQAKTGAKYAGVLLPAYRCASDTGESSDSSALSVPLATTNYVGNFGVGIPVRQHDPNFMQGIFGENSRIRIRDIRDGTSNVVLAGERRLPQRGSFWQPSLSDGPFNSYWAGMPAGTHPLAIVGTVTDGDLPLVDSPEAQSRKKQRASDELNPVGALNGLKGPNPTLLILRVNKRRNGTAITPSTDSTVSGGFSSSHPGGTQILMGDGTVRFISDSIDLQVYVNLMRRNDGETLTEF